jgi:hypothetical protein
MIDTQQQYINLNIRGNKLILFYSILFYIYVLYVSVVTWAFFCGRTRP